MPDEEVFATGAVVGAGVSVPVAVTGVGVEPVESEPAVSAAEDVLVPTLGPHPQTHAVNAT